MRSYFASRIRSPQQERGQAMVEFAFTIPMFLAILLGFLGFGLILYSYLTVTLASREGARALIYDPSMTVAQVQQRVRDTSISLDRNALTVLVEPNDRTQWVSRTKISVTAVYTVPLPTVSIPNLRGPAFTLFSPIPVTAVSVMTIE